MRICLMELVGEEGGCLRGGYELGTCVRDRIKTMFRRGVRIGLS